MLMKSRESVPLCMQDQLTQFVHGRSRVYTSFILELHNKHYSVLCYSNTTVYYEIHERSGVTNLIHDRRSCVDFTLGL